MNERPVGLIGGIGLTEVTVYSQRPAPDGLYSGCPHVHAVTDEGYFVLQGHGAVEFHDVENGYRRVPLEPGEYVHFPPLVMHRLISDENLVILGMMGNAGLAERGEARIYFGPEIDANPERYRELMALPKVLGLEGALQRRDAAVTAYEDLMALWERQDHTAYFAELRRFFRVHREAMVAKADTFLEQVRQGPLVWGEATAARIANLPEPAEENTSVFLNRRGSETALGMCGVLRPILMLEKVPERTI